MHKLIILFMMAFALSPVSAREGNTGTVKQTEIKSGWKFRQTDKEEWLKASVPGCVHTDLMNNKKIDDPFYSLNEKTMQWIGEKNWSYETKFNVSDEQLSKENIRLVFKGLDTYAKVYLNDNLILSADNMFREWNVECRKLLKPQDNVLRIDFRNVFDENMPKYNSAPYRLQAFDNNDQAEIKLNLYSRKAGYHYGWDWGPRLITCGVWRPVYLETWDDIKLDNVFVMQNNVSKAKADINSVLEVFSSSDQDASVKLMINDKNAAEKKIRLTKGMNKVTLDYTMKNPKLWWTNGLGEQYLYNFRYQVASANKKTDTKNVRVGVRSLELVREKDSIGTSFYFRLNGTPLFAKGANYIPQDNFQNRVTPERYRYMISSAAKANMNILRVWGGGIYEEDNFYDLCDEYGILVWHDLMFACGMYPSDKEYLESVKQELTDNIKRIRNHPALALYCGNNENEISWSQWGWKQMYNEDTQKQYENDFRKLFYELIPSVLKETDPTRFYHPSSPGSSFMNFSYNDGDAHYWGVWHGKDPFEKYNDNIPRFMTEYGFQSYPEMNTIKKYAAPEDRTLHSEVMLSHQRCMSDARKDREYGNRLIQEYLERQYRQPKDFQNYVYVSQLVQAEGVKIAVEAHRRNMNKCMGSIFWQIDDCWPVASWSSIDYYGNWKALQYYARNFFEAVHAAPYINGENVEFHISSDRYEALKAQLEVTTMDFDGKVITQKKYPVNIKPNSSSIYQKLNKKELTNGKDESRVLTLVKLVQNGKVISENILYYKHQKELALEKPIFQVSLARNGKSYAVELRTDRLAKNVFISTDETEGAYSDNFFDLLPGEVKTVVFTPKDNVSGFREKVRITSLADTY
ncbi:MAG: beta-mannosidase [Syntrophothermus sp.]